MTEDEYKKAINEEDKRHNDKKKEICRAFALANSTVNVGDILTDESITIKVEKIIVFMWTRLPSCVYEGPKLRKADFKPYKSGERGSVCKTNITSHICASNIEKAY